jgi:long-chain-fatty-acid--CoA ligase ACSBG
MLSHDNYVWLLRSTEDDLGKRMKLPDYQGRIISYLPMNHVAAQILDMYLGLFLGAEVYFTDISALRGALNDYVLEIKPTIFLGVPRIWEKFEEKLRTVELTQGPLDPIQSKKLLGLEACQMFFAGAAPMAEKTRIYLNDKDMYINNTFGMSEACGTITCTNYNEPQFKDLKGIGPVFPGFESFVLNADEAGKGELAFRSRSVFMGYLKNEVATRETKDKHAVLHSGDEGRIDPGNGVVSITGRLKEIIMTSGGENVAPVPIEHTVKEELPFISNAVLIGDQQKYIQVMLTLKVNTTPIGKPTQDLSPEAIGELEKLGITGLTTVSQAAESPELKAAITAGIKRANLKAPSAAAMVKDWFLIHEDFWVGGGELTPTLKLMRREIARKHEAAITKAYSKGTGGD